MMEQPPQVAKVLDAMASLMEQMVPTLHMNEDGDFYVTFGEERTGKNILWGDWAGEGGEFWIVRKQK
jgi:hypothetical protein